MPKLWFEQLFGAPEKPENINGLFDVRRQPDGRCVLHSRANNKDFSVGRFLTPNLEELHRDYIPPFLARLRKSPRGAHIPSHSSVKITHRVVYDITGVHAEHGVTPSSGGHAVFGGRRGAEEEDRDTPITFQAASQFNCLEFPGPDYTPEMGITNYIYDYTQGPACAIACPAGTIYRNYFAVLPDGYQGQTARRQLNGLADAEEFLKSGTGGLSWGEYWRVRNGYVFSSVGELSRLTDVLQTHRDIRRAVRSKIRVGVQQGVDVLMQGRDAPLVVAPGKAPPRVTQVYCSAVSVAYSGIRAQHWAAFARVVLEAAYEATLWSSLVFSAGADASPVSHKYKVYLTFLGAGAFGNDMDWIICSMAKAVRKVRRVLYNAGICVQLDVVICHYRMINREVVDKLAAMIGET